MPSIRFLFGNFVTYRRTHVVERQNDAGPQPASFIFYIHSVEYLLLFSYMNLILKKVDKRVIPTINIKVKEIHYSSITPVVNNLFSKPQQGHRLI